MKTITDAQLAEMEARCNAATEGPWRCNDPMLSPKMEIADNIGQVCKTDCYGFEYPECWSNGEFISHARADVPALLAEVRRLREAVRSALVWFGPSFEQDDDENGSECPSCGGLTRHNSNCPYPKLMEWNK